MKKRVSKKASPSGTYKRTSLSYVTFENTRRQKPYTVRKARFKLTKTITLKNGKKKSIAAPIGTKGKKENIDAFKNKLLKAGDSFYKNNAKNSKKIFHVRLVTRRRRGKVKKTSGFSLRTRTIRTKKDFDELINNMIDEFKKKSEKYGEGLTDLDITGFEMQVEGNYGKRKRRKKSKVISARRKSTKKRR